MIRSQIDPIKKRPGSFRIVEPKCSHSASHDIIEGVDSKYENVVSSIYLFHERTSLPVRLFSVQKSLRRWTIKFHSLAYI